MGCNKRLRQGPPGPKGDPGDGNQPGEKGDKGDPGDRGPQGIPGDRGRDGVEGKPGQPGRDGSRGADGRPGADGAQGIPGEKGEPGYVTAADESERILTTPTYIGQHLFQEDDASEWYAPNLDIGSWIRVGTTNYPPLITFGFVADTGEQGANQNALANALFNANLDWVVFGGDNSYGGESEFLDDWQAFNSDWVVPHKAYPVLGNHDLDGASNYALHTGHFTYLPGNKRYWTLTFGNNLLQIFVLNDGVNTAYQNPVTSGCEPDGNTTGSAQHTWFVEQLEKSTAKWKLVFFHHPPVTTEASVSNAVVTEMDWPEFAHVDGIFCGHEHLSEWLTLRGTPVINASGAVKTDGDTTLAIQGADATRAALLWVDDRQKLFARVNVTPRSIVVEFVEVATGVVIYQRALNDTTTDVSQWSGEVIGPVTAPAEAGDTYFVGHAGVGMLVSEWFVSAAVSGTPALTGKIKVNGTIVATWSITAGQFYAVAVPTDIRLLFGALVQVVVDANAGYATWYGLQVTARGRIVK